MPVRLPSIPPDQLTPEQRALYDRNREQIAHGFTAFTTARDDGALLGPWGVFLHEPAVGQAHYDQIAAVTALQCLPEPAKQVAILVVGARYRAAYELYAHAATAASEGMDAAKVATIAAGERPTDLSRDEAAAYDVASALVAGGVLSGATYRAARDRFGQGGLNELVFWVGLYAQVSITLNAFDVPSEESWA
ncbi:carboxymuconolactone decarboxylase family protein [uncultured Sphingomonas sp.]|uniref:carboxymuconolactone decarboxylase family protein n=1 Tax=uncultured Sphingomonas sp. TaxID=158754 RepID=UPI0035CAFDAB